MAPGLVFEGLLIDPPDCLPFILHGLLWEFPNNLAAQGGGGSGLAGLPFYYPFLGYSEEGFEGAMVQTVMPNHDIPFIPSQKVLG